MKCECCGEREADRTLLPDPLNELYADLPGVNYASQCRRDYGNSMATRIRARRAAAKPQWVVHTDEPKGYRWVQYTCPAVVPGEDAAEAKNIETVMRQDYETLCDAPRAIGPYAERRELAKPPPWQCEATDPYAEHRLATDGYSRAAFDARDENLAAQRRMAAWDRKERPRMTKDRRELAKPPPWQCDESDP